MKLSPKLIKTVIAAALVVVLIIILVRLFRPKASLVMSYDKNDPQNQGLTYFVLSEFDTGVLAPQDNGKDTYINHRGQKKVKYSGRDNMKIATVEKLDAAREIIEKEWNEPNPAKKIVFSVNSGYRSPHYNAHIGGVNNSAHTFGYAADISTKGYDKEQIDMMLEALRRVGFDRFGIYDWGIHIDDDPQKSPNVAWNDSSKYLYINFPYITAVGDNIA